MSYGLLIGAVVIAWGAYTIWSHSRECPEGAACLYRFGSAGGAAALILTVFCGYEIAETAMLTAVTAPMVSTDQRCNELEAREVQDLLQCEALGPQRDALL